MRYVNNTLTNNETVLKHIRLTKWEYANPVKLIAFPFVWLRRWSTEYAITNQRLITKTGLIRRRTDELRTNAIESVSVKQGILGRIFGYGDVIVSGRGSNIVVMPNVASVTSVKKAIEEAVF